MFAKGEMLGHIICNNCILNAMRSTDNEPAQLKAPSTSTQSGLTGGNYFVACQLLIGHLLVIFTLTVMHVTYLITVQNKQRI